MAKDAPPIQAETSAFIDQNWSDVLSAVDATYAELVDYQFKLETQNAELDGFRTLLTSILTSVNDVMVVVDRLGVIESASTSLERIAQVRKGGLKGKPFMSLLQQADREGFAGAVQALRVSKGRMTLEASLLDASGPTPFDFGVSGRYDARKRLLGAVIIGHPLGELRQAYTALEQSHDALKQAQAQMVRNEKLASLGRLLAGVAHELNNPISFVYANAHALERYIGRIESYFSEVENGASNERLLALHSDLKLDRALRNLRSAIDGAKDGSERVRDIVNDLRRLSSDGTKDAEIFDLAEVSRIAARWVERGSKSDVTTNFVGCESVLVSGNPGHIQQVVMNLVQNATDALKEFPAPEIVIELQDAPTYARLVVRDNGPGVPVDVAKSIFDPFFTTKAVGQGTGLGLAICHKIAEEHSGKLTLEPSESGAAFQLTLPKVKTP